MADKSNKRSQKMTAKQRAERDQRAADRQLREKLERERKDTIKRVFAIVVCVILVIALSLPTMGLLLLGGSGA